MGWAPTQTVLRADMRLHRGSLETQGLEEGTSIGLGGLPGGEDMWGAVRGRKEALLGRRSRQGEGPRGELPAGGNVDVRL